jgi:hypothetical protein
VSKLPHSFSIKSIEIGTKISDGRAKEAMYDLIRALESGKADGAVQKVAAEWIKTLDLRAGDAKALRGDREKLPERWIEVAETAQKFQRDGHSYEEAVARTAEHLNKSERFIQTCLSILNKVQRD